MSESFVVTMFALYSLAAICWSFHYIKRIVESIFVHRFSHATMPIQNLFKVSDSMVEAVSFFAIFCLYRIVATTGKSVCVCVYVSTGCVIVRACVCIAGMGPTT